MIEPEESFKTAAATAICMFGPLGYIGEHLFLFLLFPAVSLVGTDTARALSTKDILVRI